MYEEAKKIVAQMTLEEKASLCSGEDFWTLKGNERLGLTSIMVSDGPHGLRKQSGQSDHVGVNESIKATCFPAAATTACSWDRDLVYKMGQALGDECLQEGVSVLLGPGANIKRSPLCGRNFEYFSEDPVLSGEMAAAFINGVQSKGIGSSLKHYAMNNQEANRMIVNAVVDYRAQREIYLKSFEIAVRKSQPWTVMCSYNKVDDEYLSENKKLLKDVLKDEWQYKGAVVTDWGACNDRVKGIEAGLDLEMPGSFGRNDERIVKAVKNGKLSVECLDKAVVRVVDLILKCQKNLKKNYTYDIERHHKLAKKIAANSSVLLKNDDILPIKRKEKVAVIGRFAKEPRYQGAGSSKVNPYYVDNLCDCLDKKGVDYDYTDGYGINETCNNLELLNDACRIAANANIVIIVAGLPDHYESEGFDRKHLNMPNTQIELIRRVSEINDNTVVILQNGAPVVMPWINDVKAVLECYLGGQAGSSAIADILFGDINPSGKIAETFPIKLDDNPSFKFFPGTKRQVKYRESIYVGYRYYDTARKEVLFPFGHGLSYTEFEYSDIKVKEKGEKYSVSFKVKNVGKFDGSEIVQVYVQSSESTIFKPQKELVEFDKRFLRVGESVIFNFELDKQNFAFFNTIYNRWHVEDGEYTVLVGASSRDIRLKKSIKVTANYAVKVPDYKIQSPTYYDLGEGVLDIPHKQFEAVCGYRINERPNKPYEQFDWNITLDEIRDKVVGRLLAIAVEKRLEKMYKHLLDDDANLVMLRTMTKEMPLRSLAMLWGEELPKYFVDGVVLQLNGKTIRGLKLMFKK